VTYLFSIVTEFKKLFSIRLLLANAIASFSYIHIILLQF